MLAAETHPALLGEAPEKAADDFAQAAEFVGRRLVRRAITPKDVSQPLNKQASRVR